jgi:hypothetical protein
MRSLREDGWRIVREGRTTVDEVIWNTKDEESAAFTADAEADKTQPKSAEAPK